MERLRGKDLRALVDFLIEGEGVEDLDAFVRHVLRGLPRLVPCASISYNEINTRRGRIEWVAEPDEVTRFRGCEEILSRHIADHPVCRDAERTGTARWSRLADFMTRRELVNQPIYHEFYRQVDVHHQLAIMYPSRDSASLALALNREVTEFSDRERLLLNLIRPHIRRRYEQAEALTELKAQVALLARGIEVAGVGLVALGPDGRVLRATEAAQGWLRRYLGWKESNHQLPAPLAAWLSALRAGGSGPGEIPPPPAPFVMDAGGHTLSVRVLRERAGQVLVLRETARHVDQARLRAHGLTPREAEVLGWVAEGKTNPEIATILGLSPRTVHHHLGRVHAKLGVETRMAAARRAREITEGEP